MRALWIRWKLLWAFALCLFLLSTTGCISAHFSTARLNYEPPLNAKEQLVAGTTLQKCLELLGAPTSVLRDQQGHGRILSWEWDYTSQWAMTFSVPLVDLFSGSFQYGNEDRLPKRLKLEFNSDWILVDVLEGDLP
jgi:hypothetical protein